MWWLLLACPRTVDALPGAPARDRALDRELRAAAETTAGPAPYVNRLVLEASPYLRLHGTDPVDWRPWGPDAFATAKALDRPIFLSIGYATCHWCHVMQEESFRDVGVAALINGRFVPVAVDREERPDLDHVFLEAVQQLTGHAGWPATLVLTPDGDVVFAGTYLPAHDGDRGAGRGLQSVLTRIADGWTSDRETLLAEAEANSREVRQAAEPRPPGAVPGPEVVDQVVDTFRGAFDPEHGGFGRAPKFPRTAALDLLLARGDADQVGATLKALADGGVHDRVGGGFHRYAVDPAWEIPHFEKMTDDQALLAVTYADASVALGEPAFAALAREALASLDSLALPLGGYGTGRDADSLLAGTRVEGAYYTWTEPEVDAAVGPGAGARLLVGHDFDGRRLIGPGATAGELAALRQARSARTPPLLDDKWVVGTNARVVSAYARVGRVLGDGALVEQARGTADRIRRDGFLPDGRLRRGSTADQVGVLDDQVQVAAAWLDLLEATGERAWLDQAVAVMDQVEARWADPVGGWFRTADDASPPLFRPKDDVDPGGPSAASTATLVCLRLAELTQDPRWLDRADRALGAYANRMTPSMPSMVEALARRHHPGPEIVVSWSQGDPEPLLAVVRSTWTPGSTALTGPAATLKALDVPLVRDKAADAPTAWVCRGGVCQAPSRTPDELRAALAAAR